MDPYEDFVRKLLRLAGKMYFEWAEGELWDFGQAVHNWLYTVIAQPTRNWREGLNAVLAEQEAKGRILMPESRRALVEHMERWEAAVDWAAVVGESHEPPAGTHGIDHPGKAGGRATIAAGRQKAKNVFPHSGQSPDDQITKGPYGTDLTYWQAWWLQVNLRTWTGYASHLGRWWVDKSQTLRFLQRYLSSQGGVEDLSYDLIKAEDTIKRANLAAVSARLEGKLSHSQSVHFTTGDFATAINYADVTYDMSRLERKRDGFVTWYEGTIKARLNDTYDFAKILAPAHFPFLNRFTNWKGPEIIPDRWMRNLEDYGFAQRFKVVSEWEFTIRVYVNNWTGTPLGKVQVLSEEDS
jgi:hypothetical protein